MKGALANCWNVCGAILGFTSIFNHTEKGILLLIASILCFILSAIISWKEKQ